MKRRDFLRRTTPIVAAPLLLNGMRVRGIARENFLYNGLRGLDATDRVLVIIQLEGGNDGLNMVVPIEDELYYAARPTLAVAKGEALALAGEPLLALHPAMEGVRRMYDDGAAAIVNNIGYDRMNLSHFTGTEIWNTASGSDKTSFLDTGWIGRYLQGEFPDYPDVLPEDPPAIEINPGTSTLFTVLGASIGMALTDPEEFHRLVGSGPSIEDDVDGTTPAGREWEYIDSVREQSHLYAEVVRAAAAKASNIASYPATPFANALAIIARLVAGGLGTRIYKVSLGNFDTHGYQATAHPLLLGTLSDGIAAFRNDLVALGVDDRVVGMTYSEFGRRVGENGAGTDHGTAAPHIVFGGSVAGGRMLGGYPDLADLDAGGNLRHAIGFHCYYASVIAPLFTIDEPRLDAILPYGRCDRSDFLPLFNASSAPHDRRDDRASLHLHIEPNPADRFVRVVLPASGDRAREILLTDMEGRTIERYRCEAGAGVITIDVAHLPAGSYPLSLMGGIEPVGAVMRIIR